MSTLNQPLPTSSSSLSSSQYYLATFGCQMNEYDSNMIGSMLEKHGMNQTEDPAQAKVLVVNTCSIRGGAEDRAYARIAAMRYYKRLNPDIRIAVVGCMAQNHGDRIPTSLEHVDYVVGPDNYRHLEDMLFAEQSRGEAAILTEQNAFENYQGLMAKLSNKVSAHITIMRGCNKRCTYCIVPTVRGVERSREGEEIEAEVRAAVAQGIREVCLLGQTVNSYRTETESFSDLLLRLNRIEGLHRIRFTSPHPRHFDSATIEVMAACEKVCNHVHMPLQSGSNAMLKKMRRQYTRERYLEIVEELRAKIPNVAITTDLIAGFVGESERDFEDTLAVVETVRFDNAFLFAYSPREGTPAFDEAETLTHAEKQARLERLIEMQMRITEEKLDSTLGRNEEILMEGPSFKNPAEWVGKTRCFRKVIVPFVEGMREGTLLTAHLRERRGNVLRADIVALLG
jgi:tRNA-2-methylthio-N6-dimethylallyladenosine synthase